MLIGNARMYAVNPAAAAAWRALLEEVGRASGVPLRVIDHAAPAPLEELWSRDDLGCAFVCGFPWRRDFPRLQPVAAPVPLRFGAPLYASDFVVRADSPAAALEDTFGGRMAWTTGHSQSGCNAPRHHLLRHGLRGRWRGSVGPLVTARAVVEAVIDGRAEVGPLDAYWHDLLRLHEAETAGRLRVVATTRPVPMPLLAASEGVPADAVAALRGALLGLGGRPELGISGFASPDRSAYDALLDAEGEALAAGYTVPG